jgi:hypothetical protein
MKEYSEAKFFELSELLYNNDPAGTCCLENEMTDEYDAEAYRILLLNDCDFKDSKSVLNVFDEMFDDNYDKEVINKIFPTIKRIMMS